MNKWSDERVEAVEIRHHARYLCYVHERGGFMYYDLTLYDYEKCSNGDPRSHNAQATQKPMVHTLRYVISRADMRRNPAWCRRDHERAEHEFWHHIRANEPDLWCRVPITWRHT